MSDAHLLLRRPEPSENDAIQSLVRAVVDEIYGALWAETPPRLDPQDWSQAWIALCGEEIVGVALTSNDGIDDLWIRRAHRGRGVGRRLLAAAEQEIISRGFPVARLRVVSSNATALSFYGRSGWQPVREFPHESLPVRVVEMTKRLQPCSTV